MKRLNCLKKKSTEIVLEGNQHWRCYGMKENPQGERREQSVKIKYIGFCFLNYLPRNKKVITI